MATRLPDRQFEEILGELRAQIARTPQANEVSLPDDTHICPACKTGLRARASRSPNSQWEAVVFCSRFLGDRASRECDLEERRGVI